MNLVNGAGKKAAEWVHEEGGGENQWSQELRMWEGESIGIEERIRHGSEVPFH